MGVCENTRSKIAERAALDVMRRENGDVVQDSCWLGLPRELLAGIFANYDFQFSDLVAASQVCYHWKQVVELNCVGARFLSGADMESPAEEGS